MKSIWLILLVIAVVLLVAAESRKDRKPGKRGKGKGGNKSPNKKECPANCSNCGLTGRCLECDDGFVKITLPKKRLKTVHCVPCGKQISNKKKHLVRDTSKCPTVSGKPPCPTNCSSCRQDGICLVCDSGFALVSRRNNNSFCIPCGSGRNGKKVDKSQCGSDTACGKGCLKCINGSCSECKDGFELNQEKNKCKKKKDNCARGCRNCTSGICSECKQGLTPNRKSTRCVKLCSPADPDVRTRPGCEGKPNGKEGKKKRKGGKGKPNRKPTTYPAEPQ